MDVVDDLPEQKWRAKLQYAKTRPAACIGDQRTAHRFAVSQTLELVWRARAFYSPVSSTVHLSPTHYVILCQAGELLKPIEKLYSWGDKYLLTEGWSQINGQLREKNRSGDLDLYHNLPEWEKHFGGPSGPTLDSPTYPAVLANWFAAAYKTSAGLWCQVFEDGWPKTKSYLVKKSSPVGFVTAAELSPQWFTGLPFAENDVEQLNTLPNVNALWHSQDALLNLPFQFPDGIEQWL